MLFLKKFIPLLYIYPEFPHGKMKKILCTLILLIVGQSAFSSRYDLSGLSEGQEILLLSEEAEEIVAGSEVEFSAGLQKCLFRTKIILNTDFNSFYGTLLIVPCSLIKFPEIVPNLSTAKIIYPFHSFP